MWLPPPLVALPVSVLCPACPKLVPASSLCRDDKGMSHKTLLNEQLAQTLQSLAMSCWMYQFLTGDTLGSLSLAGRSSASFHPSPRGGLSPREDEGKRTQL